MNNSGLNLQALRNRNKSLILYQLNSNGAMSRKELAESLSLTAAAVTKICTELISDGLIYRCGEIKNTGRSGRREILLSLKLDDKYVFAINAERDAVTYSVCDLSGALIFTRTEKLTDNVDKVIMDGQRFLSQVPEEAKGKIIAMGVCVIGEVNAPRFSVWKDENLREKFEDAFGFSCVIENNVKAFALAELLYSGAPLGGSALYFKWGPGIGSAFSSGTDVLSGSDNGVAEIGHYIVDRGGEKCRCGRYGCLETVASEEAIKRSIGMFGDIEEIADSGDFEVITRLDNKIDTVALALVNTATIINVKRIVLFGSMFHSKSIRDKLVRQSLRYDPNLSEKIIKVSSLNDKKTYIGAAAIVAKRFFFEMGT